LKKKMRKILTTVDSLSDKTGNIACWLAVVLVFLITFEVIMRYVFNSPTSWNYETSMMMGGTIFAMGWAYSQRHNGHIRIDLFYARFSPRGKAIVGVVGGLLIFFPVIIPLMTVSTSAAWHSWVTGEKGVETYWYPPIAPFRTMVALGFFLFLLQGTVTFIRDSYLLVRGKSL